MSQKSDLFDDKGRFFGSSDFFRQKKIDKFLTLCYYFNNLD